MFQGLIQVQNNNSFVVFETANLVVDTTEINCTSNSISSSRNSIESKVYKDAVEDY